MSCVIRRVAAALLMNGAPTYWSMTGDGNSARVFWPSPRFGPDTGRTNHNFSSFFGVGYMVRIPANVTGHSGDRDRFAHGHHAGVSFVL
jgi:hypothetical protein